MIMHPLLKHPHKEVSTMKMKVSGKVCSTVMQTEEMVRQYEQDSSFRSQYNKLWDASVDYKRPAASASEVHNSLISQHGLTRQSLELCMLQRILIDLI